ncbi:MAG: magnesium/cobalt transporter CorA [Longimicrobiales bacterium]|nr:magnesium/cobalt transporter CorA [Longimicrobiales bacterium]
MPDHRPEYDPVKAAGDAAKATIHAATAIPRGVAWSALWGIRKIRKGLRKAGMPLPRVHTFRRRSPVGAAPGTLISHPDAPPPTLRVLGYGPDGFDELSPESVEDLREMRGRWPVLWIDVVGVGHAESVESIGQLFGLHRLALEDVINVHQRPKVEEYPDHLFAVTRSATLEDRVDTEQLSLFVGSDWVISFQERSGDAWDPVRERLRAGRGRIRVAGAGYLFYALMDAVVDGYYPLLEEFGSRLELLEEAVIDDPQEELVGVIHAARRDALALRQSMWPMREAMGQLYREEFSVIDDETRVYLRDAYDHTIQVIDLLENYREMASALLEVYLSSVSHRMNEVMKVLTIIATIFIPLTFIAGIYGMNFDPEASPLNMPELGWYYGYPAVWAVMIVVTLALVWYFKRRSWL